MHSTMYKHNKQFKRKFQNMFDLLNDKWVYNGIIISERDWKRRDSSRGKAYGPLERIE